MTASEPVNIVEFAAGRADEVVRMWRASFEAGVGVVDPHPLAEQREYLMSHVVPNCAVRMALSSDSVVGFVAATGDSISQLYVRDTHRRRGIGSRLLGWAKAQSGGSLWLYTFARNAGARAFYEKHGFRIVARGFEPTWQLDDLRYQWAEDRIAGSRRDG